MDFNNFKKAYNTFIVGLCGFLTLYFQNYLQSIDWFNNLGLSKETTYLALALIVIAIYIAFGFLINLISYPKFIRKIFDENAFIMGTWIDTFSDGEKIIHGTFFIKYSPAKARYVVKGYGYINSDIENGQWLSHHEWTSFSIDISEDFNHVRYMFKINDLDDLTAHYFGACHLIFRKGECGIGFFVTEKFENKVERYLTIKQTVFERVDKKIIKECLPEGMWYMWGFNPRLKNIAKSEKFIKKYHENRSSLMLKRLNAYSNV